MNAAGNLGQDGTLANLLNEILATDPTDPAALANLAKSIPRMGAQKEVREVILGGLLTGNQDPLELLDAERNTLGVTWILSARLTIPTAAPVPHAFVDHFCRNFDPAQARMAPDRISMIARGLHNTRPARGALKPLYDLLTRYPPDMSYLTTIHPLFMLCATAGHALSSAILLPVLTTPITNIEPALSDVSYTDHLVYHYLGGCAWMGMKRWAEAEEFFDTVIAAPGTAASAVQWEALKKLTLVQCISKGKTSPLPKYAHPALTRLLKSSAYGAFARVYPAQDQLQTLVERERDRFLEDNNMGLVQQALARVPRWLVAKLTNTYIALPLAQIAAEVGIHEDEARAVVLSMIEDGSIAATIAADGTVSFFDRPVRYAKADVDRVLRDAQAHGRDLERLGRALEGSRDYLNKAVKNKDDPQWGPERPGMGMGGGGEEELFDDIMQGDM